MPTMARVLVVDDDATVARLVALSLEEGQLEVEVVANYEDARERLTEPWDAIVLDIHLPGTNGLELLRHLREELGRSTPVVVLSAQLQSEFEERSLLAGADRYMTKPFSPEDLLEVVQAVKQGADE